MPLIKRYKSISCILLISILLQGRAGLESAGQYRTYRTVRRGQYSVGQDSTGLGLTLTQHTRTGHGTAVYTVFHKKNNPVLNCP